MVFRRIIFVDSQKKKPHISVLSPDHPDTPVLHQSQEDQSLHQVHLLMFLFGRQWSFCHLPFQYAQDHTAYMMCNLLFLYSQQLPEAGRVLPRQNWMSWFYVLYAACVHHSAIHTIHGLQQPHSYHFGGILHTQTWYEPIDLHHCMQECHRSAASANPLPFFLSFHKAVLLLGHVSLCTAKSRIE